MQKSTEKVTSASEELASAYVQRQPMQLGRFGVIYVGIIFFVIFSFWTPDTFLTWGNFQALANENAVTAIMALAIVVPLATGVFDLAIGGEMALGAAISGMIASNASLPLGAIVVITILAGIGMGTINGIAVVVFKIDSFIATLATGSIFTAIVVAMTGNEFVSGQIPQVLEPFFTKQVVGLEFAVAFAIVLCVAIWYFLHYTAGGRYAYATGFNPDASDLAGVRTKRIRFLAFVSSATLAAFAGLAVTARVGGLDPTIGPTYLLPAFAAAFLGTTQHRLGRFNAWGTLFAVIVLGLIAQGLGLTSVPGWVPTLIDGAALLVALGITKLQRSAKPRGRAVPIENSDLGSTQPGSPQPNGEVAIAAESSETYGAS